MKRIPRHAIALCQWQLPSKYKLFVVFLCFCIYVLYSLLYLSTTRKSILILRWCKAPVFVCKRLFLQHFAMCLVDIILFKRRWHKTPSWTSREQFVWGVLSEQSGLWHSAPVSVVACGQRILTSSFCCQICMTYVTYTWHICDIYVTMCNIRGPLSSSFIILCYLLAKLCQAYCDDGSLLKPRGQLLGHQSDRSPRRCHDDVGRGRHWEGREKTLFQSL